MRVEETTTFLARAGLIDNRRPSRGTLLAWHELIGSHTLEDCLAALTAHRRESAEYLQPAHIVERVRALEARRLHGLSPEANPDIESDYPAACRALSQAIRHGELDGEGLEAYWRGQIPAGEFLAARRTQAAQVSGEGQRRALG